MTPSRHCRVPRGERWEARGPSSYISPESTVRYSKLRVHGCYEGPDTRHALRHARLRSTPREGLSGPSTDDRTPPAVRWQRACRSEGSAAGCLSSLGQQCAQTAAETGERSVPVAGAPLSASASGPSCKNIGRGRRPTCRSRQRGCHPLVCSPQTDPVLVTIIPNHLVRKR
jgi:hypothetical protein